jgi:hypothetical protein
MIIPFVSTAVLLAGLATAQSTITGERQCTNVSRHGDIETRSVVTEKPTGYLPHRSARQRRQHGYV